MAQGLKLTPEQLAAQLKSGQTLSAIATAQGLSTVQLQNLIATSLQNSLQPRGSPLQEGEVFDAVRVLVGATLAVALQAVPSSDANTYGSKPHPR